MPVVGVAVPDHPEVAADLRNLGGVLAGLGRGREAQPYLERALRIFQFAYGSEHVDVSATLSILSAIQSATTQTSSISAGREVVIAPLQPNDDQESRPSGGP